MSKSGRDLIGYFAKPGTQCLSHIRFDNDLLFFKSGRLLFSNGSTEMARLDEVRPER